MADETSTSVSQDDQTTQAHGDGAGPKPETSQTPQESARVTLTEQQLNDRIARAEQSVLKKLAQEQAAKDAAAEQQRLKESAKWQELAELKEKEATSATERLTALETAHESLAKALTKRLKAETADWPEDARALINTDGGPLDMAASIERVRPLVEKLHGLSTTPAPRPPGTPYRPQPGGSGPQAAAQEEVDKARATGRYAPM